MASESGTPGTLNRLNGGDQITLISGIDQSTWGGSQTEVTTSGGAIDYTFDLGTSQQSGAWSLISTLRGEQFNDGKAHNALMSASVMHLLLAEGSDRIASITNKFMPSNIDSDQAGNIQYGVFMDMGGGKYEMKTGSHVKSDNFHLLAGPGFRFNHANNAKTDLGFFLEAGWGNFDTYNSFYRGNGDTSYYGAGFLARHDMSSGFYGEASLRVGRAKSEYDATYQTNFDIKSTYYGGHLGIGYILPVSGQGGLDFSAKLLYTHLEGGSDINASGDRMNIENTDSTRSHLGIQYNHQLSNNVNAFERAVWDYEFDGKTRGYYNRYSISETNPSGSTGIFSLGASMKPSTNQNLSLNFKLNGYTGKREGVGANVMINYAF